MSSEKRVKRTRSIKRWLPGGGRKLCDTIILDQTLLLGSDNDDNSADHPIPEDKSLDVLVEETESSSECEDEELTRIIKERSDSSMGITGAKSSNRTGVETSPDQSVIMSSGGNERQMEQWSYLQWELPRFMQLFKNYLDNESRYCDDGEKSPARVKLIQTGDEVGISSTFLVNLFLSEKIDQNQNIEGEVNLNLPEGASCLPRPEDQPELLMRVTLKLVGAEKVEPKHYVHFVVKVQTFDRVIATKFHFLNPIEMGGQCTVLFPLDIKEVSKLAPEESLLVYVDCCAYRPPLEWGLTRHEHEKVQELMREGNVTKLDDLPFVVNLTEKCKWNGLNGLMQCLNNL